MSASDGKISWTAVGVTIAVHIALVGGVWAGTLFDRGRLLKRAELTEEKIVAVEAGLAVKKKSAKGKKTRQPQKQTQRKVSPTDVAVDRTADDKAKKPEDKKEDDPLGDVDPESVFKKHRQGAEGQASEDPSAEPGKDEEEKEGQVDGSEWGTLDEAKGDPYVGELAGRLTTNPELEVPSTVPEGTGLVTYGCVKLNPDGTRKEFKVDQDHKSPSAAFNSAVLRRIRQFDKMDAPVPDHLKDLLVERGICVVYKY